MRILILILGFEGLKLSVNGALDLFYNPAFVERIYQNSKYHISVYIWFTAKKIQVFTFPWTVLLKKGIRTGRLKILKFRMNDDRKCDVTFDILVSNLSQLDWLNISYFQADKGIVRRSWAPGIVN